MSRNRSGRGGPSEAEGLAALPKFRAALAAWMATFNKVKGPIVATVVLHGPPSCRYVDVELALPGTDFSSARCWPAEWESRPEMTAARIASAIAGQLEYSRRALLVVHELRDAPWPRDPGLGS